MSNAVQPTFPGFPDFRANVTFVPIQFFTVVLPYCSRGTVRIVGYALRKVLGWVDERGNPTREQLRFTYRELIEQAGVSREAITEALREALERRLLRCLEIPQPDSAGQAGRSGVYELCWDREGAYTDDPVAFRGFYYPEAVVTEEREGGRVVARPKAARKNIPNAFFDHLLRQERLAVVRVVGALLFYSIQWGPGGERRVPVTRSITELARLTQLSRQHVHEAVMEARQKGYLEQVDGGCFDPAAGQESRAATYGIRWAAGVPAGRVLRRPAEGDLGEPVRKGVREEPVKKGERDRSEKVYGNRSEKVNGISIKTEHKTIDTAAAAAATMASAAAAGSESPGIQAEPCTVALELLFKAGFDTRTARHLARRCSPEIIQRQLAWLPARHCTRSRLGLLRRAIEEDWPRPEGVPEEPDLKLGRLFAAHYYAAYHGNTGEPVAEPFPKDVQLAARFLERLPRSATTAKEVPDWGRRFGSFMRNKHQGDERAKPNLSFALVLHGDEFLRAVQHEHSTQQQDASLRAQAARQAAIMPEYLAYLRLVEKTVEQAAPRLYAAFTRKREHTRQAMTGGLFLASADTLARFDAEESRLAAFAEFFRNDPGHRVPDFAQWAREREASAAPTTSTPASNYSGASADH